ncbi:MAG: hypothetical protein WBL19_01495 [Minisyncoccia bacterium]
MFVIVDGPPPDDPVFPVFLETSVGGKSDDELLSELPPETYYIHPVVREYFTSQKKRAEKKFSETVAFAWARVRDLDYYRDLPPFYAEVWARIRSLGHSLCEPSDALVLRREIIQPLCDKTFLAMDSVVRKGGIHHIYYLSQYYESAILGARFFRPSHKIPLDTRIIFRLKRS